MADRELSSLADIIRILGPAMKGAKVRRMWMASRENGRMLSFSTTKANNDYLDPIPVHIVPATPEAVEAHVEAMANALCCEHMGALPGAYSLTPEKDCAKGSESTYMWRSARAALAALMKGRTGAPRRA